MATRGELQKPEIKISEAEKELGVAINRDHPEVKEDQTSGAFINLSGGGTVKIGIEGDALFQEKLGKLKDRVGANGTSLERARRMGKAVIELTPNLDETGSFHNLRAVTIGEALTNPVDCVDRAIFMEAGVKMLNITETALILVGIDDMGPGREPINHADLELEIDGKEYVMITTGDREGEVITKKEYEGPYLQEREDDGKGKRQLADWGRPYFQTIN